VLLERFQKPKIDEEMKRISKGYVLPNMQKNTAWAMAVFREWGMSRSRDWSTDKCPRICLKMLKSVRSTTGLTVLLVKFGERMGCFTHHEAYIRFSLGCNDLCLVKKKKNNAHELHQQGIGVEV